MIILTSEAQLRSLIPNQLITVKGETSLFGKLSAWIDEAEVWMSENIFPFSLLDSLPEQAVGLAARWVALQAFSGALPMLDVVITPNGLATVGNQNLVAASKARIDRLCESLVEDRDKALALLLRLLPGVEGWADSQPGRWFGTTLFPDLSLPPQVGITQNVWQEYVRLRARVVDMEASLAEEWTSPELMAALRHEALRGTLSPARQELVKLVRAQIVACIVKGSFSSRALADIVSYIRHRPGEFPEWVNSDVADLFAPPVFRNSKKSGGYFF